MLSPLKPVEESSASFVVCDIENTPDGAVIDIDTCWRDDDTGKMLHVLHSTWAEWFAWIKPRARKWEKFRTVYAHNGGGWDWLSLADELLNKLTTEKDGVAAIVAGSSMVVLSVRVNKHFTLRLCDSLQLLRSGLEKLGQSFLGVGKVDLGGKLPHEIKAVEESRYYEYLRGDTETLLQVLEKALETLREHVAKIDNFGVTIGATAMKVFRTVGIETPISIPWEGKLKDLLRNGYKGGRVECFRPGVYGPPETPPINVYDINSLYPSVMVANLMPISDRGKWTTEINPLGVGCYHCTVRQMKTDIPAVMMKGGVGAYEVEGTFYTPELRLLKQVDKHARITVHEGFEFFDTAFIFRDYVDRLYRLRLENPETPLSLICKILLNSLYGKFAQNARREQLIQVEDFDTIYAMIRGNAKLKPLDDDRGIFLAVQDSECAFEHVGIAGTITSHARVSLYKGLLHAHDGLVYCDTDSVHTLQPFPDSIVDVGLGQWKKEFAGSGAYAGKKLYALRDAGGVEKVRAKGVSVGGRNGATLNYADMCRIVGGDEIRCEFQRPATVRDVFRGKKPCQFGPKHRTVKRTA